MQSRSLEAWIRLALSGMILSMLVIAHRSWWNAASMYAHWPVHEMFGQLPHAAHSALWCLMVLGLLMLALSRRWRIGAGLYLCAYALSLLLDVDRLTPFFVNFGALLLVLLWTTRPGASAAHRPTHERLAGGLLLVLGVQYAWAGVNKLQPGYLVGLHAWLLEPWIGPVGAPYSSWYALSALAAPLGEMLLGLALLWRRTQRWAVPAALFMHAAILLMLGPLGRDHGMYVWPWNVGIPLLVVLCVTALKGAAPLTAFERRRQWHCVLLLSLAPVLYSFGVGWAAFSYRMYAGSHDEAVLSYAPDADVPVAVEAHAVSVAGEDGTRRIGFMNWSMLERGLEHTQSPPGLRHAFARLCEANAGRSDLRMTLHLRATWLAEAREVRYRCRGDRERLGPEAHDALASGAASSS